MTICENSYLVPSSISTSISTARRRGSDEMLIPEMSSMGRKSGGLKKSIPSRSG